MTKNKYAYIISRCKVILSYTFTSIRGKMREDIYYVKLFDIYSGLLTDNQRELFYLHYCLDLSFAEIAEQTGTARQSVFDAIKKVKEKLEEYEKVLKLDKKFGEIKDLAKTLSAEQEKTILDIIEE